ncbi:MAG: GspH/FimT family protein [Patescibacteria group bacterium]|nr:GspH/FimT family protein [Patescibacteria group bacterium]
MNQCIFEKRRGFSLFEVLAILSIIILLSTISIPYLRKYQPNLKLNAAARGLTADLRYAQQMTVTEQVVYLVDFDLDSDSYQILKTGAATSTVKAVEFDNDVSFQQIIDLPDNQAIFNFYGGVSEAGQIILVNTNGRTATINVKPSGYVQLEE